jgi:hypothetical protein
MQTRQFACLMLRGGRLHSGPTVIKRNNWLPQVDSLRLIMDAAMIAGKLHKIEPYVAAVAAA